MNESNIEKSKVNNSKVKHIEQGEFETNDKIIGVFNVNADTTKISNSSVENEDQLQPNMHPGFVNSSKPQLPTGSREGTFGTRAQPSETFKVRS